LTISCRLQDEPARVEDELLKPGSVESLLNCFVTAKANSFENLLDPLLKITRLCTSLTILLAKSSFFSRLIDRLTHSKAVVRLNLLRILRTVCDAHPNRSVLVERYGLDGIVDVLSREDGAVLVRELAREIGPSLRPAIVARVKVRVGGSAVAPRKPRRAASESETGGEGHAIGNGTPRVGNGLASKKTSRTRLGDVSWTPKSAGERSR
jgi:hypothetical protein